MLRSSWGFFEIVLHLTHWMESVVRPAMTSDGFLQKIMKIFETRLIARQRGLQRGSRFALLKQVCVQDRGRDACFAPGVVGEIAALTGSGFSAKFSDRGSLIGQGDEWVYVTLDIDQIRPVEAGSFLSGRGGRGRGPYYLSQGKGKERVDGDGRRGAAGLDNDATTAGEEDTQHQQRGGPPSKCPANVLADATEWTLLLSITQGFTEHGKGAEETAAVNRRYAEAKRWLVVSGA